MAIRKLSKKEVASLGGIARQRLHGNLGTVEGRKRGGLRSAFTHERLKTGFYKLVQIKVQSRSVELAELLGILAGDGHVSLYQATVTTNSQTDMAHARHCAALFQRLFGIRTNILKRKKSNACVVVISSRLACDFLVRQGAVRGNKIGQNIGPPQWVVKNKTYRRTFVRGLFDTDGCVFVDEHRIRGRIYKNLGMAFSNRAPLLLRAFKDWLEDVGLHPTQKTNFAVFLRREKDIQKYFTLIGSSNPKHMYKVQKFFSL